MSIFNFLVNNIIGISSVNAESKKNGIGREYDSEPLLLFGYLRIISHSYSVMQVHIQLNHFHIKGLLLTHSFSSIVKWLENNMLTL